MSGIFYLLDVKYDERAQKCQTTDSKKEIGAKCVVNKILVDETHNKL